MDGRVDLTAYPICRSIPRRLTRESAWHEHVPFGMFLVGILEPQIIVELGTHAGESYCAFCQAVQELNLDTRCFAIDTWEGDAHSGAYGGEMLDALRAHHDPLYGGFSSLVQCTFEEARHKFPDGAIDLLHIDGNHTFEAVKQDFETWLPKMSSRGVLLLHDICVTREDFGVWKLWGEIRAKYPTFEFVHGHGLGVVAVGPDQTAALRHLVHATEQEAEEVRTVFAQLGARIAVLADPDQFIAERSRFIRQREELRLQVQAQKEELDRIHGSLGWRLMCGFICLRDWMFPAKSWRRNAYDASARWVRALIEDGRR